MNGVTAQWHNGSTAQWFYPDKHSSLTFAPLRLCASEPQKYLTEVTEYYYLSIFAP